MHLTGTNRDDEPRDERGPVISRILSLVEQSRRTPYSADMPSFLSEVIPRPPAESGPAPDDLVTMLTPLLQSWGQILIEQKQLLLRFLQTGNCNVELDVLSDGKTTMLSGRVLFVDLNGLNGSPNLWLDTVNKAIPSEQIQAIRFKEQDNTRTERTADGGRSS